ncbi:MAG: Holliday junction resolvase RuvX [Patescibacteria group bacterium]
MTEDTESKFNNKFVVSIDFGSSTTGLALGKNGVVTPVRSVISKDKMFAVQQILRFVKENKASAVVVGLPLSIDGKETKQSIEIRRFAKILKTRLGTQVLFVDEFGSTNEAEEEAIDAGLPQKSRKKVDSISAALILKRFFFDEGF